MKFTVASAHEESRWDKVVPNGIDGHVKPILQQNMWRVYHFHDTSRTAKVKQEHNISNNKSNVKNNNNDTANNKNITDNKNNSVTNEEEFNMIDNVYKSVVKKVTENE